MKQIIADLLLLSVALVWGLTFPAIKDALQGITPFTFLTIRFLVACIFLIFIYIKKFKKITTKDIFYGIIVGSALFSGYTLQTIGIKYTTASNAAFITGLAVVLVPFINIPFAKQLPNRFTLLGAFSAAIGLGFLTLNNGFTVNFGDFLVFFCAVSFALHIILVGKFAPQTNPTILAIIQIGIVAVLSWLFALNLETFTINYSKNVWIALAICSIPATSLAYLIQNNVQQYTSPTRTAIIFSMEPVFGAIFSYFWMGEVLTTKGFLGSILVLFGILVSELKG